MQSMMTTPKLIIFTDLDGTLLDRETYSFEAAQTALYMIRFKKIPLILSSSKTRAEIEYYQKKLKINYPFISENGGAVFIPKDYFSFSFPYHRELDGYFVVELGISYSKIIEILNSIREETGIPIKGFFGFTEEELTSLCGLSLREAMFARKREYDEPFIIEDGEKGVEIVKEKIKEKGMDYVWAGKFHHISGKNDKGKAVEILKELYENQFFSIRTVGIGDSLNDLPMLSAVDHPIFLKEEGSLLPETLRSNRNLTIVNGTGPKAWNEAILHELNELET